MDESTCCRCGETKPLSAFNRNRSKRNGLDSWCRDCHAAANRATRRRHGSRYNEQRRKPLVRRDCEHCGESFDTSKAAQRFHSEACRKAAEKQRLDARAPERTCERCTQPFRSRAPGQRFCSAACHDASRVTPCLDCGTPCMYRAVCRSCRHRRITQRLEARPARSARRWYMGWCQRCGEPFVDPQPHRDFCSRRCSKRHHGAESKRRRRSHRRLRVAKTPAVYRRKVYERDGWICQLCGKKVQRNQQVPHPLAPTLDHIVPESLGGPHEYANVQCAHFICNARKGNRGYHDHRPDQLRLVG